VISFTFLSVDWADKMVAASICQGLLNSKAVRLRGYFFSKMETASLIRFFFEAKAFSHDIPGESAIINPY
jgi:hypothetical protein